MKRILLFMMVLILQSCKSDTDKKEALNTDFEIPTDWQLDNLRGKVKMQTCFIKDASFSAPIKKEVAYDTHGNRVSEEIWIREDDSEKFYSLKKTIYSLYENNFRSYDTYGAGKSKYETTEVQWFSSNSYSAVILREVKTDLIDRIEATNDDQGKVLMIEKESRFSKTQKIRSKSEETYLYDEKGYLIGQRYSFNDEPFITYRIDNKSFDKQGNVTEFIEYDENNEISSEVKFFYEYY